jgi:hypothetical protein
VDELGVAADRYDLSAFLDELAVPLCQSGELRCSDEGEIRRIEEQHRPCAGLPAVGKAHRAKITLRGIKGFEFEVRYFLTYLQMIAA